MILIFDTETTGLWDYKQIIGHPSQPQIVQLAALMMEPDGTERMRLDVVIYRDDVQGSDKYHGITTEFASSFGVNEGTALFLFEDMMEVCDTVVAHNLDFDRRILTNSLRLMHKDAVYDPFRNKNMFCTMLTATPHTKLKKKNGQGGKFPTLSEAHIHFMGEDFEGAHQAINDVLATKRVFLKLQEAVS